MSEAARFRDSTQILLPAESLDGLREDLSERFMLTISEEDSQVRLIGTPTEIKDVSAFLTRNGIAVA
jgi:hypothetical protein